MLFPQDVANEICQIKNIETIKKNACCAFVFIWCLHLDPSDIEAIQMVDNAIKEKVIDSDCTVYWAKMGEWLTGRKIEVEKVPISSIKKIKERTPVLYSMDGISGHWVGVENGEIKFNPKKDSKNVKFGKPISMRVIKVKGLVK